MKTIQEWFEQAKADGYEWAGAAIRNYDAKFDDAESLSKALGIAFIWMDSPEGWEFWSKNQTKLLELGL